MTSRILKRMIAVVCVATMTTAGMTNSVGAVELVNSGVAFNSDYEQQVKEFNMCVREAEINWNSCLRLIKPKLCYNNLGQELCKLIQTRIDLINKLDKIKIRSVSGIGVLKTVMQNQKSLINDVFRAIGTNSINEKFVNDFRRDYDENLLKEFNSWYYSGVVLHEEDNVNQYTREKQKLFGNTIVNLKKNIEDTRKKLNNNNLQDHNRLFQLEQLKTDVEEIENRLETKNFEDGRELAKFEVDINKIASESGLLYDIEEDYNQDYNRVYNKYKATFEKFCNITSEFSKWRDSKKIDKKDEIIRTERVAALQLGCQLQNNFDVGTAKVFLQFANRVIEKMDTFKKNYKEPKIKKVDPKVEVKNKMPDVVEKKFVEFVESFNKFKKWRESILTKLFTENSKIGISFEKYDNLKYNQPRSLFFNKPKKKDSAKVLIPKADSAQTVNVMIEKVIKMYKRTERYPTSENIEKLIKLGDATIKRMNLVMDLNMPFLGIDEEPADLEYELAQDLDDELSENSEDLQFANLDLDSDGFYELLSVDPDSYDGDME